MRKRGREGVSELSGIRLVIWADSQNEAPNASPAIPLMVSIGPNTESLKPEALKS